MVGKMLLGEPVVIGRREDGAVFALRDLCPHRGIPLHYGHLEGDDVRCCYHGWKISTSSGCCTEIPSLTSEQTMHLDRIKVGSYPCREVQGNIWVYFPRDFKSLDASAELPPVPVMPGVGERAPQISISMAFDCDIDQAVFGFMDPLHVGHVHTVWWWGRPKKPKLKQKSFTPSGTGFRLQPVSLEGGALIYRLLGKKVTTEIYFELPSVRVEHVRGDRHTVVSLTTATPLTAETCEVHECVYWTIPVLGIGRPLFQWMATTFLGQDRDVVRKMKDGQAFDPPIMLVDDADTQFRWYTKLKKQYVECQEQGKPFENPLAPRVLRYRS